MSGDAAATNDLNSPLAKACQQACVKCCREGKIFIPDSEFARIEHWLTANSPADLPEFRARSTAHDGFHLYEQGAGCQFLDTWNLCRLHVPGVKPRECFWWPLHVFAGADDQLEVCVSTDCCSAYQHVVQEPRLANELQAEVEGLGRDLVLKFRKQFPGVCQRIVLKKF
jgi:hypothetical protein